MEEHETPEAEEVISIQPTCADGPLAEATGMCHKVFKQANWSTIGGSLFLCWLY